VALLFREVALKFMAALLRGFARVVTAKIEHLFYKRAGVPKAAKLGSR
jgi:hypothetical protein